MELLNCKDILRALKKLGWEKVSTNGDHIKLRNDEGRTTTVPYRASRQLAHGTISAICRQTGVSKKVLLQNA